MKRKYGIYESQIDETGSPVMRVIKEFKNEPEAKAFYGDKKNIRRYGSMFMFKNNDDCSVCSWDDRKEEWVSA